MYKGLEDIQKKIVITGGHGMVGISIYEKLIYEGYQNVLRPSSKELDLRNQNDTRQYFLKEKPDVVIMTAAKVGGIQENLLYPAEFITDNGLIEINTIKSAFEAGVSRLIMVCSSSIYPASIIEPTEEDLLKGEPDPSNEGYSLAKLFGVQLCKMYRKQYGVDYCCVIPCNLYGPYDRFIGHSAHVVPALIYKFQKAIEEGSPEVNIWGTGKAMREFMYVDDFAECCYRLMIKDDELPLALNVGTGDYIKISELAEIIKVLTGYKGTINYDSNKPEGQFLRKMNLERMNELGLFTRTTIKDGLVETYKYFIENRENLR